MKVERVEHCDRRLLNRHIRTGTPLVITNLVRTWPAFQKWTPEYLAAGILNAIRKNRTETVLGSEARRLLRFNRYFPRLTNWLIARKVKKLYS